MTKITYHHGDLKNALIQAGIKILASDGVGGLSLRKVAREAGVSHAAPYAHFADKQDLIAAIASDGHRLILEQFESVQTRYANDPLRQFVAAAWAYLKFGLDSPDHYRITFSGVLQDEHSHPNFIENSQRNMQVLKTIVEECREAGILNTEDISSELQAVVVWGILHGLVLLIIQQQVPGQLLEQCAPEEMLAAALRQVTRVRVDASMFTR
ncbi:MAG: TetR/AcrR family transcriptional regulator [Anaerolineales bacterium]